MRSIAAKALSAKCHAARLTGAFGAFDNPLTMKILTASSGTIGSCLDARIGGDTEAMESRAKILYLPFPIKPRQEI